MLELKYGPLPQWAKNKNRMDLTDADTIERWAANLIDASTLESIFDSET